MGRTLHGYFLVQHLESGEYVLVEQRLTNPGPADVLGTWGPIDPTVVEDEGIEAWERIITSTPRFTSWPAGLTTAQSALQAAGWRNLGQIFPGQGE